MFITKKHIPRRTFLRGAGVTLALPLLEAMLPAQTPSRETALGSPNTRFVGIFNPHGWTPSYWAPYTEEEAANKVHYSGNVTGESGPLVEMPFIHTSLEPFKDQLSIIAGLDARSSFAPLGGNGGFHSRAAGFMTGYRLKKTAGSDVDVGMATIDQQIAQKIGQETLLPSMQFGIEDPGGQAGICGWGYACAYTNTISWSDRHSPMPMEISPQVMFERMFGAGSTPEERALRRANQTSVLDSVTRKVTRLKADLTASDRNNLDSFLDNVREIERRLDIAAKTSAAVPTMDVPYGVPESYDEHVKLHWDLMIAAFQGDISRVSSIMLARDTSPRTYPESGVLSSNHGSSHHGENDERRLVHATLTRYLSSTVAYFVDKLGSTPDLDGSSLLDNTLIMWGSNMGKAAAHNHFNAPHMLIGGASGQHKGGRYLIHRDGGPSAVNGSNVDLLLTVLDMYGTHHERLPESSNTTRVAL